MDGGASCMQPSLVPPNKEILAPFVDSLFEGLQGAVTISRHVTLPNCSEDAIFVAATHEAAELFGFAHPDELVGRVISTLHKPEHALQTRLYAWARYLRHPDVPASYPMCIRNVQQRRYLWVQKEVTQMNISGATTWVTQITPLDQDRTHAMLRLRNTDELIREFALRQLVQPEHIPAQLHGSDSNEDIVIEQLTHRMKESKPPMRESGGKTGIKMLHQARERLDLIPMVLEDYCRKHGAFLQLKCGKVIPIDECLDLWARAYAEGKLLCLRCLNMWVPRGAPEECSRCRQAWDRPYIYGPYTKARHNNVAR